MTLSLEEHISTIIQARKNKEQVGHIWLYGFHEIVNDSVLEYCKIKGYLEKKLEEHSPFTKFRSSVQMLKILEAFSRGLDFFNPVNLGELLIFSDRPKSEIKGLLEKMKQRSSEIDFFHVHLPINNDYHLEFPLLKRDIVCNFLYTKCEGCKDIEEHGFPEIFLRESVYFKNPPNMYDNRISVNHQDRKTITSSYNAIQEFVNSTSIKI